MVSTSDRTLKIMGYGEEFSTVDSILDSRAETLAVDAFALSLIKAERQVRKLFTYLVYQSSAFNKRDARSLRETLATNKKVYFEGMIAGLDALSPVSVKQLVGARYTRLWPRFKEFAQHRNKIFHGQITVQGLSRKELLRNVSDIKAWCADLAAGATNELGCDGFVRNSFRKSSIPDLESRLQVRFQSIKEYADFIRKHMER
jgi:hypothetical protein